MSGGPCVVRSPESFGSSLPPGGQFRIEAGREIPSPEEFGIDWQFNEGESWKKSGQPSQILQVTLTEAAGTQRSDGEPIQFPILHVPNLVMETTIIGFLPRRNRRARGIPAMPEG